MEKMDISYNIDKLKYFTDSSKLSMYIDYAKDEIEKILKLVKDNASYDNIHEMKNVFVSFYPSEYILDKFNKFEQQKDNIDFEKFENFVRSIFHKLKLTIK